MTESFKGNDGKLCFFTGLPSWDILQKLFKYVHPCLSSTSRSLLTPFQQLLLTLMRLRLNLSCADLGFRFNIHMSTVSRIFTQVIEILYYRLRPLSLIEILLESQCQWIFADIAQIVQSSLTVLKYFWTNLHIINKGSVIFSIQTSSNSEVFNWYYSTGNCMFLIRGLGWKGQ